MILQRLRDETRPSHEQLEAHIDLLGRPWSLPFYQTLLEKFYGFYAALEPAVLAHPEWQELGINVSARAKIGQLNHDLSYLGLSQAQIEALPRPLDAPNPARFAQALGCAYVLEGSTLGGQIISRHLKKEIGVEPGKGCSFFFSYGEQVGPMWREFTGVLNSVTLSESEADALVESAIATFSSFDRWLADIL